MKKIDIEGTVLGFYRVPIFKNHFILDFYRSFHFLIRNQFRRIKDQCRP
ncbi:hypothetical protein LEP1GSC049_2265 [Leptospira kirschneri serovar Cynopteri str. 3522 CT]|nr:hypothetical protein LEP1GSC065_3911 [Leptospira kirschneri serovar Sokoine str. RM1]EPG51704.1 hypothetical protein LEP1GSC049_2265 [Leptospira kirschneri serovar Cynopteri str. 3522 CT]